MPRFFNYTVTVENSLDFQRRKRTVRALSRADAVWVANNRCKRNPASTMICPPGWHIVSVEQEVPRPIHTPPPFNKGA